MTAAHACVLCDTAAAIWTNATNESRAYDEGTEQRMSQIAESWDDETNTHRPLGPRRDH